MIKYNDILYKRGHQFRGIVREHTSGVLCVDHVILRQSCCYSINMWVRCMSNEG